jgi:hypothetical protein
MFFMFPSSFLDSMVKLQKNHINIFIYNAHIFSVLKVCLKVIKKNAKKSIVRLKRCCMFAPAKGYLVF